MFLCGYAAGRIALDEYIMHQFLVLRRIRRADVASELSERNRVDSLMSSGLFCMPSVSRSPVEGTDNAGSSAVP